MNTSTNIDTSIADDFYDDVDLTQEERDAIHEDNLVGRAYDDHQDWKDAESLREFCSPYTTWATQWHNDRHVIGTEADMHYRLRELRDDAVKNARAVRALFGVSDL